MDIRLRDHLIKLFKVMYDRIGRDWIINTIIHEMKSVFWDYWPISYMCQYMLCWIYGLAVRSCMSAVHVIIFYRWKWLWIPANIKGAFKGANIYVGTSMTVHNHLFWASTPCMNYAAKTFLLVSSWYRENNHCVLCTAKSKKVNKNLLKRI